MPTRKNPFLGFGRGGYFSTSRTYRLEHPKATSKRGRKVEVEEREDEESKYGKYYERLSPADKAKVRSMMRNPLKNAEHEYHIGTKYFKTLKAARKYAQESANEDNYPVTIYHTIHKTDKATRIHQKVLGYSAAHMSYGPDIVVQPKVKNPQLGKGTVLIIKNPAPWFGGGGLNVRNPKAKEFAYQVYWGVGSPKWAVADGYYQTKKEAIDRMRQMKSREMDGRVKFKVKKIRLSTGFPD